MMRTPKPFQYCPACGSHYSHRVRQQVESHCAYCGFTFHRTPAPVVCAIIPYNEGIIMVERRDRPRPGALAFPGGFARLGETWQEAAARECLEEAGVEILEPNRNMHPVVVDGPHQQGLLFIVGMLKESAQAVLHAFTPSKEVASRCILRPVDYTTDMRARIAFPGHLKILDEMLA